MTSSILTRTPINLRAVGGIRVSTVAQADRYGPERQRNDIIREATRAGLNITDWIEEAVSGADDERGLENQYYQLARKHPGLHVVWSHPNRVGRHVEVTVGIARRLHRLGATVHIAGVGNLRDRRNWKEFLRDAVDAENDYTTIIYNLSNGKFAKAKQNQWPEGRQPWGYQLLRDDRGRSTTLQPHPEHAPIYRQMVDMCLSGHGTEAIAAELNRQEITPPRSGVIRRDPGWNGVHIRRILRNDRYLGRIEYAGPDGTTTTLTYPALITPGQWADVQAAIDSRRKRGRSRSPYPALLGGHLECSACGSSLTLHVSRDRAGKPRWAVYICRHHQMRSIRAARGQPLCPNTRSHRQPELDAIGWQTAVQVLTSPETLAAALASDPEMPLPDHHARIQQIEAEMADVLDMAVRFGLPEAAALRRLEPLKAERERLMQDVPPKQPPLGTDANAMAAAFSRHLEAYTTLETRKAALQRWGIRFIIGQDGIDGVQVTVTRAE